MTQDVITLRITCAPDGQWFGRLLIGSEKIVLGAFKSRQEVEQVAEEIGLRPDRVEVEGSMSAERNHVPRRNRMNACRHSPSAPARADEGSRTALDDFRALLRLFGLQSRQRLAKLAYEGARGLRKPSHNSARPASRIDKSCIAAMPC